MTSCATLLDYSINLVKNVEYQRDKNIVRITLASSQRWYDFNLYYLVELFNDEDVKSEELRTQQGGASHARCANTYSNLVAVAAPDSD